MNCTNIKEIVIIYSVLLHNKNDLLIALWCDEK